MIENKVLVLDTCAVLWLAADSPRLSKAARKSIADARRRGGVAIAGITLYEIAWLVKRGRVQLSGSLSSFLSEVEKRFVVIPISAEVAVSAAAFSDDYPSDPADRMIGATALLHGTHLVTSDKVIWKTKLVPVIW